MLPNHNPTEAQSWAKLEMLFMTLQATHMRDLFSEDQGRFKKLQNTIEKKNVDF
jgi:glucose-6-phosphate isomerase